MTSIPTFIVGTGRCGSTMLSNMIRLHPKMLSLSEFFGVGVDGGLRTSDAFSGAALSGERFWDVVSGIAPFTSFCLRNRIEIPEWLYPVDDPDARFTRDTGVPLLLVTVLPHLTDDYENAFDTLAKIVSEWPVRPIASHYVPLFCTLCEMFGKDMWIERSGASLNMAGQILATFPEARFVHVVRDGRDAALSMSKHEALRLVIALSRIEASLGTNPIASKDRSRIDTLSDELRSLLPEHFDVGALRSLPLPIGLCGEFWEQQVRNGLQTLGNLPPNRLLTLRYEDILSRPQQQLTVLTAFLGDEFLDDNWSARCAATVRAPRSTWRDLPEEQVRALTEACRSGFALLREAGVAYDL